MKSCFIVICFIICLHISIYAQSSPPHPTRQQLLKVLRRAKVSSYGRVIEPGRRLLYLTHTCNLLVDGNWYPVVDIGENVRGAMVPRGVMTFVILNDQLKIVQIFWNTSASPLFCKGNQLFVSDEIGHRNTGPYGNVFTFNNGGKDITVSTLLPDALPAPRSRDIKIIQQYGVTY